MTAGLMDDCEGGIPGVRVLEPTGSRNVGMQTNAPGALSVPLAGMPPPDLAVPRPDLDHGYSREHAIPDPYVPSFEFEVPADGVTHPLVPQYSGQIRSVYVLSLTSVNVLLTTDSGRVYTLAPGWSGVLWIQGTTTLRVASAAAVTGSVVLYLMPRRVPPAVGTGYNPPAVAANVNPAAGVPVALSSPPATLNAGSATALSFATAVRHVELQNNSSVTVGIEFDGTVSSAGSFQVGPGQTYDADVATSQVSLFSASASNLNGTVAGNVVLRGRA